MFFLKYIWQEMKMQPQWYMGLFLTDGLLLNISGLLMERLLRANDSFEVMLHCILLAPLLMLLVLAVLLPIYVQKEQRDLIHSEYRDLLYTELSHRKIMLIKGLQTAMLTFAALLVFAPLSTMIMRYLRLLEGDPLWQNGWRNRSTLPLWTLVYILLLTASLFCCISASRHKRSVLQQDSRSKSTTAKQILRNPGFPMYVKLRRNRIRHEGKHICAALAILCILPILFSILLADFLVPADPYVPENVLYLSMTDNHPNAISTFLLTQIEQVEGVTLEKAYMPTEDSPPSYRSAVFRLDIENWQECAAAVRKIVEHDRSASLLRMNVPLEYTLIDTAHEDTADLLFLLLLFISACALCFSGTCTILLQYLHGRREELQVLSAFGMRQRDCFKMLLKTLYSWVTLSGMFSLLTSSIVWILYDGITSTRHIRGEMMTEMYRVPVEFFRSCVYSGMGYIFCMFIIGIIVLRHFVSFIYPHVLSGQRICK